MANIKITDLTAYGNPTSTDVLPIVDVGADVTKKVSIADLLKNAGFGTESLPGIAFDGDPDTGIYRPGANQLALSTNGAGRLFVDANGNVGVGQAVWTGYGAGGVSLGIKQYSAISAQGLVVESSSNGSSLTLGHTGSVAEISAYYGSSGSYGPLAFKTSNLERLRITSAGLVGIGTSAPGATLHVEGLGNTVNQRIFTSDNVLNATASLTFGTTPGSRSKAAIRMINVNTGNAQGALSLLTDDGTSGLVDRLYIAGSGHVGIGTTSPGVPLEVFGGNARVALSDGSPSTLRGYEFASATTVFGSIKAESSGGELRIESGFATFGGFQTFYTNGSERARIDSSGRLLVGTSSDSGGALLQVNGDRIRVATAKTPASASDTGTAGEICWDASYIYVCTATNTWKRAALSTW